MGQLSGFALYATATASLLSLSHTAGLFLRSLSVDMLAGFGQSSFCQLLRYPLSRVAC